MQWLWSERVLILYAVRAAHALPAVDGDAIARNRVEDLQAFQPTERWHDRQQFIDEALRRIAAGMQLYTYVSDGVLLHFAWMVPRQSEATFTHVHQYHRFEPGTAVLFNAYTHPRARGGGLHERSMRRRIADALAIDGTEQVVAAFESTNQVSRGVAVRCGMRPELVFFERIRLGRRSAGSVPAGTPGTPWAALS